MLEKTLVIGLDSVPYSRLKDNIDVLSTIKKIANQGTFSKLKSTIPCSSAPAWTSFMTGLPPKEHRIFGFFDKEKNIHDSNDIKHKKFWDDVEKKIIMNIPLTFPPKTNIMVSGLVSKARITPRKGFLGLGNEYKKIVSPKGLYKILQKHEYEITAGSSSNFDDYIEVGEKRKKAFLELLKKAKWDLGVVMFDAYDRISHSPSCSDKNLTQILKIQDNYIKNILKEAGDCNVIILSDHGEKKVEREIYLNQFFVNEGLAQWSKEEKFSVRKDSDARFFAEEHSEYARVCINRNKRNIIDLLRKQDFVEEVIDNKKWPHIIVKTDGIAKLGKSKKIIKDKESHQHSMEGIFLCSEKVDKPESIIGVGNIAKRLLNNKNNKQ